MNLETPASGALFFVAMWIVVGYAVGLLSGWHEVARAYRHAGAFAGACWSFQSGQMRLAMRYRNVLTVGAIMRDFTLPSSYCSELDLRQYLSPGTMSPSALASSYFRDT